MHDPVEVRITLEEGATLPLYQTSGSAGLDLCTNEDFDIKPLERRFVGTGLRIALPSGFEAQVRPRSGLAVKHGITMLNSPGTIDSDYRGEIKLIMINLGEKVVSFNRGDRVAQLVVSPAIHAQLQLVVTLDDTERGTGGFGSTGV
jgi:dUTP pyrophosphatase